MNKGTIQDTTIFSESLQEEMQLLIYLPANFSPLYKYSVLIASDGKDYFQLGRISRIADELYEEEAIENLIIVGVPYKNVKDRRDKYHPDGSQHAAYIRFLAQELVPYIDEKYPTYQVGMGRSLIGDSLAATVSLMTALSYPNTFGRVIMHSPLVNEEVLEKVKKHEDVHAFSLYHVIGTEEKAVKTGDGLLTDFITPNRELHNLIKNKGFLTFYDELRGDHTWKLWQPDIKRSLLQNFSL
ncbi:alpha/beta hydrolase [Psychrobacillus psychrodurans]|uniref:Alpha/beta hydrolase-fold protein n=1 Tax=Psychrobacillus psychrodurans TaxID=126157 RepID=A0A9X3R924_9BACI|nr:alpha/beta hydrolase-fold protein [Psychrobacillus psychrodurans]MCZ8532994.1 alpha/beta hydrolase-fold protein [Psychrobacillus psychrodurans]